MDALLALGLAIGILIAGWTYVAVGVAALPVWAGIVAWGCFFAAGGKTEGLLKTIASNLSGVLWAYFRPGIKWDMGVQILLLIFAAVVLGGLGTIWGAIVGAFIIGLFTELSTLLVPAEFKFVGALLVLIVVLLIRPQGLLGKAQLVG